MTAAALDAMAARIDPGRALPWPRPPSAGDHYWFAAIDSKGRAASVIQSLYFEFGSGVVLPHTGIVWQNRGASFRLAEDGWNALKPRHNKPFHTLNPALARFDDRPSDGLRNDGWRRTAADSGRRVHSLRSFRHAASASGERVALAAWVALGASRARH